MHFVAEYLASEQRAGSRDYQLFVEARCDQPVLILRQVASASMFRHHNTVPHTLFKQGSQKCFPRSFKTDMTFKYNKILQG